MSKVVMILMVALLVVPLGGCTKTPDPTDTPVPPTATLVPTATLIPTATFIPTATIVPTATLVPTPTLVPTSMTPAPEEAFFEIGSKAILQGEAYDVAGSAMVAGLQTIVMRGFTYDASCDEADIRLGLGDNFDETAAVLMVLEDRAYKDEILVLTVPSDVEPGQANSIAVYCTASGEVHGWGQFR